MNEQYKKKSRIDYQNFHAEQIYLLKIERVECLRVNIFQRVILMFKVKNRLQKFIN